MRPTIAIILLAVALTLPLPAHAAEDTACRPYATAFAQQLMNWVWRKSFSYCSARDQVPALPGTWESAMAIVTDASPIETLPVLPGERDTHWRVDLADIGVVPATDRASPPSPPARPVAAPAKKIAAVSSPAAICAHAHRRIVWTGKSWRCA